MSTIKCTALFPRPGLVRRTLKNSLKLEPFYAKKIETSLFPHIFESRSIYINSLQSSVKAKVSISFTEHLFFDTDSRRSIFYCCAT